MGGWSLSAHHYFNPADRTLYLGSGGRRSFGSASAVPNVLTRVAGSGDPGAGGDGGPALNAQLYAPSGLSVMSDGSLLIADSGNCRIRKVDPQGKVTTVAGTFRFRSACVARVQQRGDLSRSPWKLKMA